MKNALSLVLVVLIAGSLGCAKTEEKVYITRTGKKYHQDGCEWLSRSKKELTLAEAKDKGYTPCGACNFFEPGSAPVFSEGSDSRPTSNQNGSNEFLNDLVGE